MDAEQALRLLASVIDDQRWDDLEALLHADFHCRFVHTGEQFDRAGWVRLNAEYPGFDHLVLEEVVADGDHGAARSHVTGFVDGVLQHYGVATFVALRDGLIHDMTEVWADVGQPPPPGTRPG